MDLIERARQWLAGGGRSTIDAIAAPPVGKVGHRSASGHGRYGYGTDLARNEALDADVGKVTSIFREAATGQTSRLIDLYKHARVYDSRFDAVCATRVSTISGRPYVIKPPPGFENDARAKQIAANVATIFNETRGFSTIVGHLAHAVLEHVAVLQHSWRQDHRGWWVTSPQWIHPNRAGWRLPDVVPTWAITETATDELGKSIAGRPFSEWPDRFVVFAPVAGRSDYPWMRGAMRSRMAASIVKRMGLRWWLKMLERWGQPQVYATRDPNAQAGTDGDFDDDELLKALRGLASDWRAVLPAGADIKTIPATVVENIHRLFIEHQDREDAIAVLGQNLTTDMPKGGSYAAAKAHQNVRLDLLASDLTELAECITDQWIEPLVRFNWSGAPVPYIEFVLGWRADLTPQDYQTGAFTADEYRGSKGFDPEADGTGRRYYSGPAPKVVTGKRVDAPAEEDAIDVEVVLDEPAALTADTSAEDAVAKTAAAEGAAVADLAFNGAQVQALQGIVTGAGTTIGVRSAQLMITTAFPSVDEARAREMVEDQRRFAEELAAKSAAAAAPAATETDPTEG